MPRTDANFGIGTLVYLAAVSPQIAAGPSRLRRPDRFLEDDLAYCAGLAHSKRGRDQNLLPRLRRKCVGQNVEAVKRLRRAKVQRLFIPGARHCDVGGKAADLELS